MTMVVGRHDCFQPVVENQVSPEVKAESEKLKDFLNQVRYAATHGINAWASVASKMELDHSFMQRRVDSREIERVTFEDASGVENGVQAVIQGNPTVGPWVELGVGALNEHVRCFGSLPGHEMNITVDTRSHT